MPNLRVPANAVLLPSPSRRELLAGTAAAAATALIGKDARARTPHAGVVAPDAELVGLKQTFAHALDAYEVARRRYNRCEKRYFARCPCVPKALTKKGSLGRSLPSWSHWSAADLRRMLKNPKRCDVWDEARAALALAKTYEAGVRRAKRESDVIAAEAAHIAAIENVADVSETILAAPLRSLAGLALKADVVKTWGKPEWWDPVEGRADTYERLAAQVLDAVGVMAEAGRAA
jgi:hypothetical protein